MRGSAGQNGSSAVLSMGGGLFGPLRFVWPGGCSHLAVPCPLFGGDALKKFFFEIQLGYAPGCGWLRSPYGRDTFERAFEEGRQYVENAMNYREETIGLRVVARIVKED